MINKMLFYLLISLISLSLESTDIREIPYYGKITVQSNSYLYLYNSNFKSGQKIYLKLSFSNGYNNDNFYIYTHESYDRSESSFRDSFTTIYSYSSSNYNMQYTFYYSITLSTYSSYLLIKVPDVIKGPSTSITVEHTSTTNNGSSTTISFTPKKNDFIFGGVGIAVIIICVIIIFLWCKRRASETVGIIDAPLVPSYQVQPAYVQPTYVQPAVGAPVYIPPAY